VTGIQDKDVYAEACAVLGDEGALAWLRVFRKDLADHLDRLGQGKLDTTAIRDMAHRTAGRAGLFGFRALSEASASLEDALRRDDGIAVALDHWTRQARLAVEASSDCRDAATPDTRDRPTRG